jgi:heme-degrading monooxygenase HmoA
MADAFNSLPDPPYFSVIFTSRHSPGNLNEYAAVADRMQQLAIQQPGFLGMTTLRGADGVGITVSYWSDAESIANWRKHAEHQIAQQQGRDVFYDAYRIEICRVERVSRFQRPHSTA